MQPACIDSLDPEDVEAWRVLLEALDVEHGITEVGEAKRSRQAMWASAYVATFDRATAARVAGVALSTLGTWRKADPTFRALVEACDSAIRERVAGEVYRRAVVGVEQGIWHQGRLVGSERKYSDRMLELLARRVDPAWGERSTASIGEANAGALVARILADDSLRDAALALAEAAAVVPKGTVIDVEPKALGTP